MKMENYKLKLPVAAGQKVWGGVWGVSEGLKCDGFLGR